MPKTTVCSCVTAAAACRVLLCVVLLATAVSCQQQQEAAAIFRLGVLLLKETVFTDVRRFYQKNILNDTVASTAGGSASPAYILEAELHVDVKASPRSLHELACQRLVAGNVSAVVVFSDDAAVYKYVTAFMASLGVPIIGWNPKAATVRSSSRHSQSVKSGQAFGLSANVASRSALRRVVRHRVTPRSTSRVRHAATAAVLRLFPKTSSDSTRTVAIARRLAH